MLYLLGQTATTSLPSLPITPQETQTSSVGSLVFFVLTAFIILAAFLLYLSTKKKNNKANA